jgi:hypothetical protein
MIEQERTRQYCLMFVNGLPNFTTVGLPQGAVREGEKRVVAAVKNSGYEVPPKRITINLAPARETEGRIPEHAEAVSRATRGVDLILAGRA